MSISQGFHFWLGAELAHLAFGLMIFAVLAAGCVAWMAVEWVRWIIRRPRR